MSDVQAKIQGYEKTIQQANMMKVKAETQMQQLQEDRKKLLEELAEMGVKEEDLPGEIIDLNTKLDADLKKLDAWEVQLKEVLG